MHPILSLAAGNDSTYSTDEEMVRVNRFNRRQYVAHNNPPPVNVSYCYYRYVLAPINWERPMCVLFVLLPLFGQETASFCLRLMNV